MALRFIRYGMVICAALAVACTSVPGPAVISITPAEPSDVDTLKVNFVQYSLSGAQELDDSDDYDYEWFLTGADGGLERQDELSEDGGIDTVDSGFTKPGQEWTVQVTPIAPGGGEAGPSSTATVSIRPVIETVTVRSDTNADADDDDTTAIVADDLICEWTLIDFGGPEEDATAEWTNQAGDFLGSEVTLSEGYAKGDTIRCTVTLGDETLVGQSGSDELRIGNTAPSVSLVSVLPSPPSTEDTLFCAYQAVDADADDVLAARVSWTRNGANVGFKNFAMSDLFACGQQVGPAYECWGFDVSGVFSVPLVDFVEVVHGDEHACGLDPTGRVECWGNTGLWDSTPSNTAPYTLVRAGIRPLLLEGAAGEMSCALDVDGRIECWGTWDQTYDIMSQVPTGAGYLDIGMGDKHICALDADGYVECWGDLTNEAVTEAPTTLQFSEIVSGSDHACGILLSTGMPHCWGEADKVGAVPSEQMYGLDSAAYHTCGIRLSDGTAECWGYDYWGYGHISNEPSGVPMQKVEAAGNSSCGLDTAGKMHCWGQTGDPIGIVDNAPVGWTDDLQAGDEVSCSVFVSDGLATSDLVTSSLVTVTAP